MSETHRVRELAKLVSEQTGASVDYIANPRNEMDENELHVANDRFLHLGLNPIILNEGLMEEVTDIARRYTHRYALSKIPCTSLWKRPKEKIQESALRIATTQV